MTGAGTIGEVDADSVDPVAGITGLELEEFPVAGSPGLEAGPAAAGGFPAGGVTGFGRFGEPVAAGLTVGRTGSEAVEAGASGETLFAWASGETVLDEELAGSTGFASTVPRTRMLPSTRDSERFPSQSTTNKLIG